MHSFKGTFTISRMCKLKKLGTAFSIFAWRETNFKFLIESV